MLSRLLGRQLQLHLRLRGLQTLTLASSSHHPLPLAPSTSAPRFPSVGPISSFLHKSSPSYFSTHRGNGGGDDDGSWKFTPEADEVDSVFGAEEGNLFGITEGSTDALRSEPEPEPVPIAGSDMSGGDLWSHRDQKGDIFDEIDSEYTSKKVGVEGGGADEWETAEGYKPWSLGADDEDKRDVFDIGGGDDGIEGIGDGGIDLELDGKVGDEEQKQLEKQEQELLATMKGPNRAFGDLIAASGITEDMIDSLILLKDVRGIQGLPPLMEIEDKAIARMNTTSTRSEIERKKQEEIAQARVRKVDEKGRAYGTGRRKCSIARVWIHPGDGKFIVNDKPFDAYFPIIDNRAELLRPFTVTKTLGLWDVNCTVKGGGVSGQVGAIRLGISRALQNWEPGLRPYLKAAGYMTRDPRVVERKKPGKAKARKSFQWVKR